MKFNEIGFSDTLLKNITNAKYESTTGIQENVIPLVLKGKDVVGIAQTGTGKTAAFVLPIIEKLIIINSYINPNKITMTCHYKNNKTSKMGVSKFIEKQISVIDKIIQISHKKYDFCNIIAVIRLHLNMNSP